MRRGKLFRLHNLTDGPAIELEEPELDRIIHAINREHKHWKRKSRDDGNSREVIPFIESIRAKFEKLRAGT
jgi:hypothetical protein